MRLVYDSSVRLKVAIVLVLVLTVSAGSIVAQERDAAKPDSSKVEPKYDDTFAGSVIELSSNKVTVSRSILGKPPEKRVFMITADTRIEGKLKLKLKVTVGYVASDDGDIARLIVVRQKPAK